MSLIALRNRPNVTVPENLAAKGWEDTAEFENSISYVPKPEFAQPITQNKDDSLVTLRTRNSQFL